jgi:RHS repeat-associated protein
VLGNITAIGNASGVPTATETYSYDPLYRLASIKNPAGTAVEAYTYNKTGDRLSKTGPGILTGTYTYATGTHQLTGTGTTTRQVDARGNTTASTLASGAYTFGYNQRNRLTSVQRDGTILGSYVLNALGQRVQKTAGGATTRFDYDDATRILSESTGTTSRDYVWMGDLPVGIVDRTSTTTSVAFVHADGLGTPRVVTNASGSVLWQWAYASNPFGESAPTSATGFLLNLRFPGQYFDGESGLSYNINRDYEAATGRYVKSDPIGLNGGTSTFTYVDASPLIYGDPLGLQVVIPIPRPIVAPPVPVDGLPPPSSTPNFPIGAPVWGCVGAVCAPANAQAVGSDVLSWLSHQATPKPGSKPKDCPAGTKPIDQTGLGKDDIHGIKEGVGAGPRDWTGIAPNGDVITGDHEGNAVNNGNYKDFLP